MFWLIIYIAAVIIDGGLIIAYYKDHPDEELSYAYKFLSCVIPFVPILNIFSIIGLWNQAKEEYEEM